MTEPEQHPGSSTSDPAATSAPAPLAPPPPPPPPPRQAPIHSGRRYGFLCSYCTSRLEAVESMAGQSGTCPTCGNAIIIPILDHRGRLIDPTSGEVIKQDPHPVHAYAAAGHKAPQIVVVDRPSIHGENRDDRLIRCPRCQRNNPLSANNCAGCGLPFTMEGTVGDAVSGTNTWAVASLVLGIVAIPAVCFVVPAMLAIVFGLIAMRSNQQASGQASNQGLAITGLALGCISLAIGAFFWARTFSWI